MALRQGLLLALQTVWRGSVLDSGPYSACFVLCISLVAWPVRALTLAAVPWFIDALEAFIAGGRRPALRDRFDIPTPAGRLAGIPWPADGPSSPGSS